MKKIISLFLSGFFLMTTTPAYAVSLQVGENFNITEPLFDDAYMVAANADVDADISGDLYVTAGQVNINGNILEDLVVGGGRVVVNGNVSGDIRLIGGQIIVNGNVGDDLLVAGGQVDLGRDAVVGGSVIAGAGLLTIDGRVREDVRGGVGALILNGVVERNVVVTIEDTIDIDNDAQIGGNFEYSALIEGSIPDGVVRGKITFNEFQKQSLVEEITYLFLLEKLVSFLAAVLLMLLVVMLMPKALITGAKLTRENILKSFGVGILTLIIALIGFIILMITIVGIPFALIMMAAMIIIMYMAKIFTCAWIGGYILNYNKKLGRAKMFSGLILILLGYYLIGMIPFVGWLINLVLFLIGVGTVVLTDLEYFNILKKKKLI